MQLSQWLQPCKGSTMRGAAAISEHLDTRTASIEVAELLADAMAGPSDLVFVFASFHHRETLEEAVADIRNALSLSLIHI